ncbi:MAG TPA: hypothetical protein VER78_06735 [Thermoanaerobaculia bacterium]|nr:hypothetical protein [Thermoanaerobaculia bacterium]
MTGAAAVCLYLLVLAFPEPLFAYSLARENFRVYSRHAIDPGVGEILDEVNRRLSRSEINVAALTHRVFILDTPAWNSFFNGPYRAAMGRNCEIGNAVFIPRLDVQGGRVVHFDGRSAEAASILAHECAHTLVQRRLGLIRMWRLPFWKKEGYAEYIGMDEARSEPEPMPYRRARLRWKFLLEKEGLTFDQVMQSRAVPGQHLN